MINFSTIKIKIVCICLASHSIALAVELTISHWVLNNLTDKINLIKNSQAVKKGVAPKKAMVKKDVKSKVAAKKWL